MAEEEVHVKDSEWGRTVQRFLTGPHELAGVSRPCTAGESQALQQMRAAFSDKPAISDEELLRFLRARDFHVDASVQLLKKALVWREEAKPENIRLESVRQIFDNGFLLPCGVDRTQRPVFWIYGRQHRPAHRDLSLRCTLWCLQQLIEHLPPGKESFTVVADLTGFGYSNIDSKWVFATLDFVQKYYPERLYTFFLLNAPTAFWVLWKLVKSFIAERTRPKGSANAAKGSSPGGAVAW